MWLTEAAIIAGEVYILMAILAVCEATRSYAKELDTRTRAMLELDPDRWIRLEEDADRWQSRGDRMRRYASTLIPGLGRGLN